MGVPQPGPVGIVHERLFWKRSFHCANNDVGRNVGEASGIFHLIVRLYRGRSAVLSRQSYRAGGGFWSESWRFGRRWRNGF